METSVEECLETLHAARKALGVSPTKKQYEGLGMTPAASTIIRVVGGWNEAKSKAGLETTPGRGSRMQPKPEGLALPEGKVWNNLSGDQRWHYRHVERNTERTLERRQRLRSWLIRLKQRIGGCCDCGVRDPSCLDFHHPVPDDKTMAVNKMVLYGYSKARIEDEIANCILLCGNCHRIEHNKGSQPEFPKRWNPEEVSEPPETRAEIREWTQWYRETAGCAECGISDHRCLVFHHEEQSQKRNTASGMIADRCGFRDVKSEVSKCSVLCANCHRRVHYGGQSEVSENDSV